MSDFDDLSDPMGARWSDEWSDDEPEPGPAPEPESEPAPEPRPTPEPEPDPHAEAEDQDEALPAPGEEAEPEPVAMAAAPERRHGPRSRPRFGPPAPDRERTSLRRRLAFTATAVVVLVGIADRADRDGPDTATPVVAGGMPVTAPRGALSSSWFCALSTAQSGGAANGAVVIANPSDRAVHARVTALTDAGGPQGEKTVTVAARAQQVVRLQELVTAPYVSAVVDIDGGEVAVEHAVSGPLGDSVAPCASAASPNWYVADGATTRVATMLLGIMNPFPETAVVDLSFATEQGRTAPAAFNPVDVPARSLRVIDVGTHVRRRQNVAVSVHARHGRVVVDRLQLHNGEGRKGVAIMLAAPEPALTWYFPDGFFTDGVVERYHLYNPSPREVTVDVELTLESRDEAAEPFVLKIPPRDRVTLVASQESRIPKGVAHAVVVRAHGEGVIAQRTIDATPPSARAGLADTLGGTALARIWVLATGAATDQYDEWVVVHNPGRRAARLSIVALAGGQRLAIEGLQNVSVPGGRRMPFRLGDHIRRPDLPVVVTSDQPVVVERSLFRVGAPGISATIGIPERNGLED